MVGVIQLKMTARDSFLPDQAMKGVAVIVEAGIERGNADLAITEGEKIGVRARLNTE